MLGLVAMRRFAPPASGIVQSPHAFVRASSEAQAIDFESVEIANAPSRGPLVT
jgi:hypothetical protein